jgi:hypothetical protein
MSNKLFKNMVKLNVVMVNLVRLTNLSYSLLLIIIDPGHDINIFLDKGHVYPESTKNGFVSLIAETENAEISASPSKVNIMRYFKAIK